VVIDKVLLAENPKDLCALRLLYQLHVRFLRIDGGSPPKLLDLGYVGIGLEAVGVVLEGMVEFRDCYIKLIFTYNLPHNTSHTFIVLHEVHHQVENVRIDISSKLLSKPFFVILYFLSLNLDELLLSLLLYFYRRGVVQSTIQLAEVFLAVFSVLCLNLRDNVGNEMRRRGEEWRGVEGEVVGVEEVVGEGEGVHKWINWLFGHFWRAILEHLKLSII
jgi:hypothetical protein